VLPTTLAKRGARNMAPTHPPVNERDVLTINDQPSKLVKEDLETHTGLFAESLEVYSIKVMSAFEDDRPSVGDMNAAEAGE
jgi:hypothetical protein